MTEGITANICRIDVESTVYFRGGKMFCEARELIYNSNSTGAKGPFLWPPKS